MSTARSSVFVTTTRATGNSAWFYIQALINILATVLSQTTNDTRKRFDSSSVCFQCNAILKLQHIALTEVFLTLTEVFPRFFLSCKTNARVKLAKTGHGPHSSKLVVICDVLLLFALFYVLVVCNCVLYYCHRVTTQLLLTNISYLISHIIYHTIPYITHHIISYHIIQYHTYHIIYHIPYHISYHIIPYHISYHISYHIMPYHISYHLSYHIIPYHIPYHTYHISYHITSYHIISYIISHHTISHIICIILHHTISYHTYHIYHITSYHIISYHTISYIISHHTISYIVSHHIIYHIIYIRRCRVQEKKVPDQHKYRDHYIRIFVTLSR